MIISRIFPCIALSLCLFFPSCRESLNRPAYIHWVRDYQNGLHVEKRFSEFVFDVQYQPEDYIQLVSKDRSASKDQSTQYYTLKVNLADPAMDLIHYNVSNSNEKQRKLYYFSYLFQQDIYLEEAGQKMPCVLYHFEQSDLTKSRTFVLAFEKNQGSKPVEETMFVIDSPYFSSLPIKIKVSKENIPALKI